jgi:hypothetical protein
MLPVTATQSPYQGTQYTLLPSQYQAHDRSWITVPLTQMILGQQLGPNYSWGMWHRPSEVRWLRVYSNHAKDFIPTWAGQVPPGPGWTQWQAIRQATAAQTSPAIRSLQARIAAQAASRYNIGIING